MLACSTLTAYTAKVMADVVKRFPHLVSYTDIIALGLGGRSRAWINGFFVAELGTVWYVPSLHCEREGGLTGSAPQYKSADSERRQLFHSLSVLLTCLFQVLFACVVSCSAFEPGVGSLTDVLAVQHCPLCLSTSSSSVVHVVHGVRFFYISLLAFH